MNKKDKITQAAIEFMKEGKSSSDVKISDLANRAGVGKGTAYMYFNSKDEIFEESIIYIIDMLIEKSDRIDSTGNFKQVFMNNLHMYNDIIVKYKAIIGKYLFDLDELCRSSVYEIKLKDKLQILEKSIVFKFNNNINLAIEENIVDEKVDMLTAEFIISSMAIAVFRYNNLNKNKIWNLNSNKNFDEYAEFLYKMYIKILQNAD